MGHLGFSYIGLVYLLMLTIPNLIWTKHQPKEYQYTNENKTLLWFERIGQIGVTCTVLIFSDFNLQSWSLWSIWLVLSAILITIGLPEKNIPTTIKKVE